MKGLWYLSGQVTGNDSFREDFDFFNKVVQIVAWILLAISSLVLILGGVSAGDIAKVPTFVVGIVDAVALFIVFIKKMLQVKDTNKK